jgi:uncharacterized membrane protein YbhN (UPF0104 family)
MAEGYDHTVGVDEATPSAPHPAFWRRVVDRSVDPAPPEPRSGWVRVGRVVFAVVILLVLVVVAARHVDDLRHVDLHPAPAWLLVAAPFTFLGGVLLPLAWRETVAAYGTALPRATAVRVWCISQASRFIPGNVALVASRVVLAAREGVAKKVAAFTLALEVGFTVVWGGAFASWLPSTRIAGPLRLLLAIACGAMLLAAPLVLRRRRLYDAVALYGCNNLATAAGSTFVAASLHTLHPHDLFLVIGAVNLAAVVGMIGLTPAGLGVREGVIAVLLGPTVGAGNAAAIAVAMRAWDFAFELVWIAVALAWERRQAAARIGT